MRAESTIKPISPFEVETSQGASTIRFYANIQEVVSKEMLGHEEISVMKYEYDEHLLKVPSRLNLEVSIRENYDEWLQLAIEKENEPKPETDKEKILRLEKENRQLGIELSDREINEVVLGTQISDIEIQLLELQIGGMYND